MAIDTPPSLLPPPPPNDTNPDSGLLGKGGADGGLPEEIVDNYPLAAQALQQNEISLIEAQNPGIIIEGVLGGLPVAERNQEYFAVVFEAGDTSPEIIDQTQFKVTYLCDSFLNVSKPAQDTISTKNITQNFERQKRATVRVDQGTVLNQQLAGTHTITAVGSLEPIAGTQIGKGPYEYVTTMSFVEVGQLNPVPGLEIANYYLVAAKQGGYQDLPISYATSGYTDVEDGGTPIGAWSYGNNWVEANSNNPARLHYDGLFNAVTGSGSFLGKELSANINPTSTQILNLGFNTDNYYNKITLLTGSIEGRTRIAAKVDASITVVTSSILDLFASTLVDIQTIPEWASVYLKVYKSSSNGIEEVGSQAKSINIVNKSLIGNDANSTMVNMAYMAAGNLSSISNILSSNNGNFSWAPIVGTSNTTGESLYSSTTFGLITDYFDIEENDSVFAEISLGEELSSSAQFAFPEDSDQLSGNNWFTSSLGEWKNDATFRKYKYKWGSFSIRQEVPPGNSFFQGITGVTASYYISHSNGAVSESFYNYTSSYWIGSTNTTSSIGAPICFITASTALTNFYGGEYIQVNPGTEEYNNYNANGTFDSENGIGTSLYPGGDVNAVKKTWDSFGFNPIKSPFIPIVGDFIRFEYSKSKVFQIIGVSNIGGKLNLKLDNHVPSSTVLDNFVIYRIVEDGQYIILNVKKNNEASVDQAFSGIITAQYRSENLEARSDELIFDLKQAGIINEAGFINRGKIISG